MGTAQLLAFDASSKASPMCGVSFYASEPKKAAPVGMRLSIRRAQSAENRSRNTTRDVSAVRYPLTVCAIGLGSHGIDDGVKGGWDSKAKSGVAGPKGSCLIGRY
jgi:hypothetical protein